MVIWVVGGKGLLGGEVSLLLERRGISFFSTDRIDGDITSLEAVRELCSRRRPTHIINCAAYTLVDEAEREVDVAYSINATGPGNLACVANEMGAKLVHVSTDYVFDGMASAPLVETSHCAPINIYGKSKLQGEVNVLTALDAACIVRVSWLFGRGGKGFFSQLVKWLSENVEVRLVGDQISCPTYAPDVAEALLDLLDSEGVFHFANGHPMSRVEMAHSILKRRELKCRRVAPVPSSAFPALAKRPLYTAMDTSKVTQALGRSPRGWEEVLTSYLGEEVYA